ncbi:MAG: LON peptidase substrate-binding domain-containing protein, partial [Oscillospiraceae bacterium]|nr:LON peptidase substrate-binding domain-containing protein [Oscillospiraceae bacterium]
MENNIITIPLLPLRGITVFPDALLNFDVERKFSISALNKALEEDQLIFLVTQKDIATDIPGDEDLFGVGTVCCVRQVLKIPGSPIVKVLVEGKYRARLCEVTQRLPHFVATVEEIPEQPVGKVTKRAELLLRQAMALFDEYSAISNVIAPEVILGIVDCEDHGKLADYVAQNIYLRHQEKQQILEELRPLKRHELVVMFLTRELELLELAQKISEETKQRLDQSQRDYYLHEQLRAIQRELGDGGNDGPEEMEEYRRKILALGLSADAEEKLLKELGRLSKQPFGSSEGAVIRTYLDTCIELPWNERTKDSTNIAKAQKCLDEDHFGLAKVKERIIEFLAVKQLAPDIKGSVLCLVGPPGVGKTSIAMSIARATNRKCARISLGGVHDEAEIRGHRKTYVGAMPGRIVSGLQQAKSMNPVMVL